MDTLGPLPSVQIFNFLSQEADRVAHRAQNGACILYIALHVQFGLI